MSLDLERSLRTEFAADAERAPVATDLAAAARRRVRARRRRLAAAAAGLAAASLLSASTLLLDGPGTTDQAVNPSPGPSLTPGTSGPVAIQQADWIDGARDISIEVKATSFDSACATALSATVQESAGEIRISVRASSRAGTACPPELRRILVSLDSVGNGRPLVDELTGKRIPPGEPPRTAIIRGTRRCRSTRSSCSMADAAWSCGSPAFRPTAGGAARGTSARFARPPSASKYASTPCQPAHPAGPATTSPARGPPLSTCPNRSGTANSTTPAAASYTRWTADEPYPRRVSTKGASSVMATVCSEWAVREPSADRMVQPSAS
ncbi:hypothetical protein ACFQ1L_17180 [Phytohabitans flavus]|uniref:hypothetical protein n=1 Tax=Phytohabitans flavus TaxID=1076124 RepID=UPI00363F9AD8